jgi:hypothetical protein
LAAEVWPEIIQTKKNQKHALLRTKHDIGAREAESKNHRVTSEFGVIHSKTKTTTSE